MAEHTITDRIADDVRTLADAIVGNTAAEAAMVQLIEDNRAEILRLRTKVYHLQDKLAHSHEALRGLLKIAEDRQDHVAALPPADPWSDTRVIDWHGVRMEHRVDVDGAPDGHDTHYLTILGADGTPLLRLRDSMGVDWIEAENDNTLADPPRLPSFSYTPDGWRVS